MADEDGADALDLRLVALASLQPLPPPRDPLRTQAVDLARVQAAMTPAPQPAVRPRLGLFRRRPAPKQAEGVPLGAAQLASVANALVLEYDVNPAAGWIRADLAQRLDRVYAQRGMGARVPVRSVADDDGGLLGGGAYVLIDVDTIDRQPGMWADALPVLAQLLLDVKADAQRSFGQDQARRTYRAVIAAVLGNDLGQSASTGALWRAATPPKATITVNATGGGPVALGPRGYTVGRSPACDVVVADPSVSRMHARLGPRPDGYVVTDLGSRNGTRVNGALIDTATLLRDGDVVALGEATLLYAQP